VFPAWGNILRGRKLFLSLEITRECPLHCPGCYAYEPGHLGDSGPLRQLADSKGDDLVSGVLALVRRYRPMHLSIVGGEPLVRYRELGILLPKLEEMGVEVQLVTSAVRPIPIEWNKLSNLHLAVSIDGLQPEHDKRRTPATYDRILRHIEGHHIRVHCTITRQMVHRPGYLAEFSDFWSRREEVLKIWFSLYTPQEGDSSEERLRPEDRVAVVDELTELRHSFRKIDMNRLTLAGYRNPPKSPDECIFALTTQCISADLSTKITPCQFGGTPVCSECGCIASAGLAGLVKYKIGGVVPVSKIFNFSFDVGRKFQAAAH